VDIGEIVFDAIAAEYDATGCWRCLTDADDVPNISWLLFAASMEFPSAPSDPG
jgi:hypothetical protein